MIGNAVPVNFSYAIAQAIKKDLFRQSQEQNNDLMIGQNLHHLIRSKALIKRYQMLNL